MSSLLRRAEDYFDFAGLRTNWLTEILAGVTTFLTMAYIIFVNPSILHEAGMPMAAVTAATCLSAAFGSIAMGLIARYPIALAPGMGLNAYFTYAVVKGMGVPWQTALGAVFLSGVAFLILTLVGVRQLIVAAIPRDLYAAVAAGVGLFIAMIGFQKSGLVVASPATMVTLGNLRDPQTLLSLFGLFVMAALLARGVRAAILLGIVGTCVLGWVTGQVHWVPQPYSLSDLSAGAFQLDIAAAARLGLLQIVFVFLFVDLFDNVGTLLAVGKKAGLLNGEEKIPRITRILLADASATIVGSLAGTSTVVSYIESSAGVAVGGRSGVTAIVVGVLFLVAMVAAPLVGVLPSAATAPALIIVGSMMMSAVRDIDWENALVAVPAFLTMLSIPLTFSIANGLAIGFTSYAAIHVVCCRFREVNPMVYVLSALFVARFFYLGAG